MRVGKNGSGNSLRGQHPSVLVDVLARRIVRKIVDVRCAQIDLFALDDSCSYEW